MSLVAGLLWPRLFSSKLRKLKVTEKYSGSATEPNTAVVAGGGEVKTTENKIHWSRYSRLAVEKTDTPVLGRGQLVNGFNEYFLPFLSFFEKKQY